MVISTNAGSLSCLQDVVGFSQTLAGRSLRLTTFGSPSHLRHKLVAKLNEIMKLPGICL